MKKIRSLSYVSNGPKNTGGYFHESYWFGALSFYFRSLNPALKVKEIRPIVYEKKGVSSVVGFVKRLCKPSSDFIFSPARTALPFLIRSFLTKNQVWVVYHSLDVKGLESNKIKAIYSYLTLFCIKKNSKARLITVAPFWSQFFESVMGVQRSKIIELPNLFAPEEYLAYHTLPKKKQIHLGMWSTKIDKKVIELAARLSHKGYYCFFTTPLDIVSISSYGYDICHCPDKETYRKLVAQSQYTLAFSSIPEGWPRVVHESFLLGTPVIGHDNAGLGDLLRAGCGFIAHNVSEILAIIELEPGWKLPNNFGEKYHPIHTQSILEKALNSVL